MAAATKSTTPPASDAVTSTANQLRDQVLAGIRQSQQLTLDAAKGWVELVGKAVPGAPLATIPGAPTKADVREAVAASFDLVQELVSAQQGFVEQLLDTVLPAEAAPKA
jgi:hypothetical protein